MIIHDDDSLWKIVDGLRGFGLGLEALFHLLDDLVADITSRYYVLG